MRPRQSSLGILLRAHSAPSGRRRFNEAEAIKPRNREDGNGVEYIFASFNEAEAIKPRNLKKLAIYS